MRSRAFFVSLMVAGLALPSAGAAQVEFGAFAGAFIPTSDLTDEFGTERITQAHDAGLVVGARIGAQLSSITLEGSVALIPTNLTTESATLGVSASADQTIISADASVLLNLGGGAFFEPFLAAGVGVKNYSEDDPSTPPGFESGMDVSFNVGVGGRMRLTQTTAIRVDIRDHISSFDAFDLLPESGQDPKLQNDILVTVGISLTPG